MSCSPCTPFLPKLDTVVALEECFVTLVRQFQFLRQICLTKKISIILLKTLPGSYISHEPRTVCKYFGLILSSLCKKLILFNSSRKITFVVWLFFFAKCPALAIIPFSPIP